MPSLIDTFKARRRLIAPLIPLLAAAVDYFVASGENTSLLLSMAFVAALVNLPARYFEYRPRHKR